MKALNLAGAVAIALTFGTTMALAQQGHVGDGSNTKPIPTTTPGYSVGTGSAHVGDGSNSKQISPTTPGYSVGTGSAQVGDGSNLKAAPTTTPGYSVGTGSAKKSASGD